MQDNSFTGQPIFGQLLSYIPKSLIKELVKKHSSDHRYRRFKSYEHLVAMVYAAMSGCESLREVCTGLQVWHKKLTHLGMQNVPRRSTISDANKNRSADFFADLFHKLYRHYYGVKPDSRGKKSLLERMFMIDSTTITLFNEVMKAAGRSPKNGKRKGGAKAHVLINAAEDVPQLVRITSSSRADKIFLNDITLPKGSILVFDRGYANYTRWQEWTKKGVHWVTRENKSFVHKDIEVRSISEKQRELGVIEDKIVLLGTGVNKSTPQIEARRIVFEDPETKKELIFLTNHRRFNPATIAAFYKQRWQIEILFKRIKQRYPLRHFLGDNENAIRIQIWCSLICDLLIKVIKDKSEAKKWSYSNLASIVRLHLASYVNLLGFLENPEKALRINYPISPPGQQSLFGP